jgi:protein tyrosine/serine phosphatase
LSRTTHAAGKDRTGLIAAIVLLLLGAPDEAIIRDYTLTTAGLLPAVPFLVARFKKEPAYNENWKGVENMGSAR